MGASRRLLLLSTSRTSGTSYLKHASEQIDWLLPNKGTRIAFVPYAAVRFSYDDYEGMVGRGFSDHEVVSVHRFDDPIAAIRDAEAIAVGGGNTFKLVHDLHHFGLMEIIRERALSGIPFVGWSAGANVSSPRLCTTNDMPIMEPSSFKTLGLIRAQINPHYLDAHPEGHMGETREERILEFTIMNPQSPVIGLREGAMLKVDGPVMTLEGRTGARLFHGESDPRDIDPGSDVSFLL